MDNFDFLSLAADRYSVRKFTSEPVRNEDVEKILEAARLAPTACNLQPQRIIVVNDDGTRALLRKCTECHFGAQTAFIICFDKNECWRRSYDGQPSGYVDASIAATHMMLEAHSIGVGTTWVMYFIPEAVRTEFALPDNIEPAAILVAGYPADGAKPAAGHFKRRSVGELVVKYR